MRGVRKGEHANNGKMEGAVVSRHMPYIVNRKTICSSSSVVGITIFQGENALILRSLDLGYFQCYYSLVTKVKCWFSVLYCLTELHLGIIAVEVYGSCILRLRCALQPIYRCAANCVMRVRWTCACLCTHVDVSIRGEWENEWVCEKKKLCGLTKYKVIVSIKCILLICSWFNVCRRWIQMSLSFIINATEVINGKSIILCLTFARSLTAHKTFINDYDIFPLNYSSPV